MNLMNYKFNRSRYIFSVFFAILCGGAFYSFGVGLNFILCALASVLIFPGNPIEKKIDLSRGGLTVLNFTVAIMAFTTFLNSLPN